ncbi:hypothetical protein Tco_0485108, partial [Tanacetum coccineum]
LLIYGTRILARQPQLDGCSHEEGWQRARVARLSNLHRRTLASYCLIHVWAFSGRLGKLEVNVRCRARSPMEEHPTVHDPRDRYLQIVASIEQYSDLSEMTLEEAIGRLKTYEERIKYKRVEITFAIVLALMLGAAIRH